MAGEHLMNLLTEAEQTLASIALPPTDAPTSAAKTFRRDPLHGRPAPIAAAGLQILPGTKVALRIELGRAHLRPDELIDLRNGSVVALDKLAGDSADIYADGRLAARGELVVVDGNFGVRVVEVISAANRNRKYQETH
jgi:flagellar motor switch protein FliN